MNLADPTDPTDPTEWRAWLRLLATPGVGLATARRLLSAFGSPQAVFEADVASLSSVVSAERVTALRTEPPGLAAQLKGVVAWAQGASVGEPARHVLTLADGRYPARVLECGDPPLLLFAQGRLELLNNPSVALVGSRRATPGGLDNARTLARDLSASGVTVVSGLAAGIDAAAHEGALQAADTSPQGAGSTVAVLGTGPDRVYPTRHAALARRVACQGLLLTEFLPGTPARADHFPRRNRIVAGLSRATLVIEAALPSGSLITARLALDMGRDVMAVPGSIHSPQAKGCHWLIKQGAQLVEDASDVVDALGLPVAQPRALDSPWPVRQSTLDFQPCSSASQASAPPGSDRAESSLLRAMGHDPVGLDALGLRTGMGPSALGIELLTLEMDGRVVRLPGQLFQRVGRA